MPRALKKKAANCQTRSGPPAENGGGDPAYHPQAWQPHRQIAAALDGSSDRPQCAGYYGTRIRRRFSFNLPAQISPLAPQAPRQDRTRTEQPWARAHSTEPAGAAGPFTVAGRSARTTATSRRRTRRKFHPQAAHPSPIADSGRRPYMLGSTIQWHGLVGKSGSSTSVRPAAGKPADLPAALPSTLVTVPLSDGAAGLSD